MPRRGRNIRFAKMLTVHYSYWRNDRVAYGIAMREIFVFSKSMSRWMMEFIVE